MIPPLHKILSRQPIPVQLTLSNMERDQLTTAIQHDTSPESEKKCPQERLSDLIKAHCQPHFPSRLAALLPVQEVLLVRNAFEVSPLQSSTIKAADRALLGLCSTLGRTIGFTPGGYGKSQDIMSVTPSMSDTESSPSKTTQALPFHVDKVIGDPQPDYVVLACVHGDPHTATGFIPNRTILERLQQKTIDCLKQPLFHNTYDSGGPAIPLIQERDDGTISIVWFENMMGIKAYNQEAEQALKLVESAIKDSIKSAQFFTLEPGNCLIIRNGTGPKSNPGGVHNRNGIIQDPKRLLRRVYLLD